MNAKVKLQLPVRGYTDIASFDKSLADYCVQAMNVRPFEPLTRRLRISQRAGLSKWTATQFGATSKPIQFMRQTNLAITGTPPATNTTFVMPDQHIPDGVYNVAATVPFVNPAYNFTISGARIVSGGSGASVWTETLPGVIATTQIQIPITINRGTLAGGVKVAVSIAAAARRYSGTPHWSSTFTITITSAGAGTWAAAIESDTSAVSNNTGTFTGTLTGDIVFTITFLPGQVQCTTPANGNAAYNPAPTQTWGGMEFGITVQGATTAATDYSVSSGAIAAAHLSNDLVNPVYLVAQNGSLFVGDPVAGFTTLAGIFNTSGEISCVDAFGKAYVVDGAHIVAVDLATKTSAALVASGGSTLPANPRLTTLYRGRLVFSRTTGDPWNWYMSKIGDPTNWDFSNLSSDGAVSGNDADAGRVGDVISALIPFADTYMIIGCPSSIYIMRGDPKAGGTIDLLSAQVGITGPLAWAQGPDGTIYFMSRHGLYKIALGGSPPQPMSSGKVDKFLSNIDLSVYQIQMGWNGDDDTLWIAAVPSALGTPQQVLVWDSRTDGFWPDAYPFAMGPTCLASAVGKGGALVGNNRRVLLVGGWDGYVRLPDANNFGDDGTEIDSLVRFAPVQLGDGDSLGKVIAGRFNWGEPGNNFSVTYSYFVGNHPQDAALALTPAHTAAVAGQGGYQTLDRSRVRGGAFCLQLQNSGQFGTTWAIESALLEVTDGGRMRT